MVKLKLSKYQEKKLTDALKNKSGVSIILDKNNLNVELILTKSQKDKIEKAKKENKNCKINFSHDQLKKNHEGGFIPLAALGVAAGVGSMLIAGYNTYKNVKNNEKQLQEMKRHNEAMEALVVKKGSAIKSIKKKKIK